jgi:hypothetical protein
VWRTTIPSIETRIVGGNEHSPRFRGSSHKPSYWRATRAIALRNCICAVDCAKRAILELLASVAAVALR